MFVSKTKCKRVLQFPNGWYEWYPNDMMYWCEKLAGVRRAAYIEELIVRALFATHQNLFKEV